MNTRLYGKDMATVVQEKGRISFDGMRTQVLLGATALPFIGVMRDAATNISANVSAAPTPLAANVALITDAISQNSQAVALLIVCGVVAYHYGTHRSAVLAWWRIRRGRAK